MDNESIGNGRTADVITCDASSVLKLFKPFMNLSSIEKEFKVASFAHSNRLNTPKPIEMVNKDNRIGIIYERIIGKSLLLILSENPLKLPLIARQMADFTDRNCHFGFFAVSGQNSVFPPNYDCFRTPNN